MRSLCTSNTAMANRAWRAPPKRRQLLLLPSVKMEKAVSSPGKGLHFQDKVFIRCQKESCFSPSLATEHLLRWRAGTLSKEGRAGCWSIKEHGDSRVRGAWWQQEGVDTQSLLKEIRCEPVAYKRAPLGQNYFRFHTPATGWIHGRDAPASGGVSHRRGEHLQTCAQRRKEGPWGLSGWDTAKLGGDIWNNWM